MLASLTRLFTHTPFQPLSTTIERIIHSEPELVVLSQTRAERIPLGLAPGPGGDSSVAFERRTGYRVGSRFLSYHQAFVDCGQFDPSVNCGLASGRLSLARILAEPGYSKCDFESGDDFDSGRLGGMFELFGPTSRVHRPYLWRRYSVYAGGRAAIMVAELLPLRQWRAIRRERGDAHAGTTRTETDLT
jgi:hypothetical protein